MIRTLLAALLICFLNSPGRSAAQSLVPPADDPISAILASHEYDLAGSGIDFLIGEAGKNDFFLVGELHGEKEIPALLNSLWPSMWKEGYRHIAAEVSPWAAYQLDSISPGKIPIQGLWTQSQAAAARRFAPVGSTVLWGCDMEEIQPEFLIRELAARNPNNSNLKEMAALTMGGYRREMSPGLLALLQATKGARDEEIDGISLQNNLRVTLEINSKRLDTRTRMDAQNERELLMKRQFMAHYRRVPAGVPSKVLVRFGRNHLHRGYDARGVSTLGNFIAEFAVANEKTVFNVGAFGAGGQASLMGETWNADETSDEPAFALLASLAKYPATLFDLRPLRSLLHRIPQDKRSEVASNLIYWADAYDALICYKQVTPLQ